MSEQNPIRLFVTHAFASHPDYHRMFEYIESTPNFFYRNCSVPDQMPSTGGKEALKEEYRTQIKNAEVVVVLSSMYVENEYWTTYQMDAAQAIGLPLVAVEPFGGQQKTPEELTKRAGEVVGWNERLIIDAIRRQARHEDTNRWEVVEFKLD
jgi:Thoeris protein ThsB, TIR-like domain